ncbi:hypothetical protein GL213_07170 [Halogeometricum borinquense]|uniref:Uncharacterized protein n=1 Tax=Halogeometricum borinquense TaxID=60847 RepID=A0A6C0UHP7_9EURY|nr:hypothetical protein [Halogeometricum borinquense]QIB74727.1 hypothetical protein G3I44_10790 [Halogeometricum borinquense]QIQ76318.1 hypothetical protein GL213_07170 [Halogeometricum borinquense]
MRRRRDPRVVVLVVAAFAVLSGVVVGMAARWPTAGIVVSFVLVSTGAVVIADNPPMRNAFREFCLRALRSVCSPLVTDRTPQPEPSDAESAEAHLKRAGLLVECDAGPVPSVAPAFERAWRQRILSMGDRSRDEAVLAGLLTVPQRLVELEWNADEEALVATVHGTRAGQWPSRAAFVADVTAIAEFRDRYPEWWTLSPTVRGRALATLRLCLDWCPTCDGTIHVSQIDHDSTGTESVLSATCEGCAACLFEAGPDPVQFTDPRRPDADAEA